MSNNWSENWSKYSNDNPLAEDWSKYAIPDESSNNQYDIKGFAGVGHDIFSGLKQIPSVFGNMLSQFPGEAYGAGNQLFSEPSRIGKNFNEGFIKALTGIANTPANIADYLARKELISTDYEGKIPRTPNFSDEEISEFVGKSGNKKGDALLSGLTEYLPYLLGGEAGTLKNAGRIGARSSAGAAHAIGKNENPVTSAALIGGIEGAGRLASKGLKSAGKSLKEVPENIIAKSFSGDIPLEEILRNAKSAEGTNTSLGRIIESPSLTKTFENYSTNVPFADGQKILSKIQSQVSGKGKEIFDNISKNSISGDANEVIHDLVIQAKKSQNKVKNEFYEKVNSLSKKENHELELPRSTKIAKDEIKAIEESPLYKNNSKFRKSADKLFDITKTSDKKFSNILDDKGNPILSKTNQSSIKDALVVSSDLYESGQKMLKSPNAIDQHQGNLYIRLSNSIKQEVKSGIEKRGSESLRKSFSEAENNYKKNYVPFLDSDVHKLIGNGKLSETFIRDVIKPGKKIDKAKRINQIQNILPENKRGLLANAYLSDAMSPSGVLDVSKLSKKLNELGPRQTKALFPDPQFRDVLESFQNLTKLNPDAMQVMFNPKTGARNAQVLGGILTASFSGIPGVALAAAGQAGLAKIFNKMMTSPEFRNKVIEKISKIKKED